MHVLVHVCVVLVELTVVTSCAVLHKGKTDTENYFVLQWYHVTLDC